MGGMEGTGSNDNHLKDGTKMVRALGKSLPEVGRLYRAEHRASKRGRPDLQAATFKALKRQRTLKRYLEKKDPKGRIPRIETAVERRAAIIAVLEANLWPVRTDSGHRST